MTETEYALRMLMYHIGKHLEGDIIDEEEQEQIGQRLIAESGVCRACNGEGEDGDEDSPPYPCPTCNGACVVLPNESA